MISLWQTLEQQIVQREVEQEALKSKVTSLSADLVKLTRRLMEAC